MTFSLILDGISLQHAGELLLDSAVSRRYRRDCRLVYRLSLEDYAFASLLGDIVTVSGNLPDVRGDTPGATLTTLNTRIRPIERGATTPVTELIEDAGFRQAVKEDLARLENAFRIYPQFFIREADAYLGNNDNLRDTDIDPANYDFRKRPLYLQDSDLQDTVGSATGFQDAVFKLLRARVDQKVASDPALVEFIQRVVVTHTALYWWYEEIGRDEISRRGARLPFATRNTLCLADRDDLSARAVAEIRDVIIPHALWDAMNFAGADRDLLRRRLEYLWNDRPYPYLRARLQKIFPALAENDMKGAMTLAREIRSFQKEAQRSLSAEPVTVEAKVERMGVSLGAKVPLNILRRLRRGRNMLREWVNRTPPDYENRLTELFPELSELTATQQLQNPQARKNAQ